MFAPPVPLSFLDINVRLDISTVLLSIKLLTLLSKGFYIISFKPLLGKLLTPYFELRKLTEWFLEQLLKMQLYSGKSRLAGLSRSVPALNAAEGPGAGAHSEDIFKTHPKISIRGLYRPRVNADQLKILLSGYFPIESDWILYV